MKKSEAESKACPYLPYKTNCLTDSCMAWKYTALHKDSKNRSSMTGYSPTDDLKELSDGDKEGICTLIKL